mgnify:CR=1 FL=1
MFSGQLDFTVASTNPEKYDRSNCNLTAPITQYATMIITSLTANCDILVLNKDDYIQINGKQYSAKDDYTNLNQETYASLMNDLLKVDGFGWSLDNAKRLVITSRNNFTIENATYNVCLLCGFYNMKLPLYADYDEDNNIYFVQANSVGYCLSTPILYLVSNVGMQSYRNANSEQISGSKIVMRLNNSFTAGFPIVVNNADFNTTILSNDLSCLEFTLVDAYLHEVKLLSPMFITIHVSAVEEEKIMSDIYLGITQGKLN